MKKEVLFEVVRDEQGDVLLKVSGTDITIYMPDFFWKSLIKGFEEPGADEYFGEYLNRKNQLVKIIKEFLARWEKIDQIPHKEPK